MSLTSNISDAISAIGAKIKDLLARVTALERIAANVVATTTYTLQASDAGKEVQCSYSGAVTVTVDASKLTAGDYVLVRQTGAGPMTLAAAAGTTITRGGPTLKTAQQGSLMYVRIDSPSTAYVGGEVAAS